MSGGQAQLTRSPEVAPTSAGEHDGDSLAMEKFLDQLEAGSGIAIEATSNGW
jgi:hypothetical protein